MNVTRGYLSKLPPGSFMIEIGSTRERDSWERDGYSTPFFGYMAQFYGHFFYTVDALEWVTNTAREICAEYGIGAEKLVNFVTMDGIRFLKIWAESGVKVDFLYLDAWDHAPGYEKLSEELHLEAFKAIEDNISPEGLVLVDDVKDVKTWEGKGRLLIPYMREIGYRFIYKGYQCLLQNTVEDVCSERCKECGWPALNCRCGVND